MFLSKSSYACAHRVILLKFNQHSSPCSLSTVPIEFIKELLFSNEIPQSYKEKMLDLWNDSKEKQTEIERVLKEKEIVLKEKEIINRKFDALKNQIVQFNEANNALTPWAIMEFVETFMMSKYEIVKGSRSEKWTQFLTTTVEGQDVANCINKSIPLWTSNPKNIANHLVAVYAYSSNYHHQSSLSIKEAQEVKIDVKPLMQINLAMTCIAKACHLKVTEQ